MVRRFYYWWKKIPIYRVMYDPDGGTTSYRIYRKMRGEGENFVASRRTLDAALGQIDSYRLNDKNVRDTNNILRRNTVPGDFSSVETVSLTAAIVSVCAILAKLNRER
jgi:hypothetical protein